MGKSGWKERLVHACEVFFVLVTILWSTLPPTSLRCDVIFSKRCCKPPPLPLGMFRCQMIQLMPLRSLERSRWVRMIGRLRKRMPWHGACGPSFSLPWAVRAGVACPKMQKHALLDQLVGLVTSCRKASL